MKHTTQIRLEYPQEMQLLCNCCGQPYYPNKSLQDKVEALYFGAERYAVCPVCTQVPPEHIFIDPDYRRRCHYQVKRLQALYNLAIMGKKKKHFRH